MDDTVTKSETELFLNSTRTVTEALPALLGSSVKWTGTFCSVTTPPAFGVCGAVGKGKLTAPMGFIKQTSYWSGGTPREFRAT